MEYSFQQVIDNATPTGKVLFATLCEIRLTQAAQKNNLEKIVNYVAQVLENDGVRRLVEMNKQVYICRPTKDEPFAILSEQYRGHAQTYLHHCDSSNVLQNTQNFAMILLEDARLPIYTFNNIFRVLAAGAKEGMHSTSTFFNIHEDKLKELQTGLDNIQADWNNCKDVIPAPELNSTTSFNTAITLGDNISQFRKDIFHIRIRGRAILRNNRTQFMISLDDAVTSLEHIKCDFEKLEKAFNNEPIPVKDAPPPKYDKPCSGTMMTSRTSYKPPKCSSQYTRKHSGKYPPKNIPGGTGPKPRSVSSECRERNHWFGREEYSRSRNRNEKRPFHPDN